MTRENGLSRRKREKLRQRQEILDAALELFCQHGYHAVSMKEIAASAEFAVGTLYKFFNNKEDLYKTLMLEKVARFHQGLLKALSEGADEIEKLRNYVTLKCAGFIGDAPVFRLFYMEIRGPGSNIKESLLTEVRKPLDVLRAKIAEVFQSGMERKLFKSIADPYQLAIALESMCNGFLFLWLENPETKSNLEYPDFILDIVFDGLLES